MTETIAFPRTLVGGVSLPRLIIGSNWFLGYSHTSLAKDKFIKEYQTRERISDILLTFLKSGIDAVMAPPSEFLESAIRDAEDRGGAKITRILTPIFNVSVTGQLDPARDPNADPERMFDLCNKLNATFCMPHQCVTDALIDRVTGEVRGMPAISALIRERGMVPGLSTHMPESVIYADRTGLDVETYIQIYNAAGFLMQVEADWVMKIIRDARHPVMTIKPLAAGKLLPVVGLAFVWNTIRPQDMVTIGVTTVDEAKEVIDLSLDLLSHQMPENELQKTRSKNSLL